MKNYKFKITTLLALIVFGCSLEENPPFLSNENVYSTPGSAKSALTGLYESLVSYNYYGNDFVFLTNLSSGYFITRRGGNNKGTVDNVTLASLKANANTLQSTNAWRAMYVSIARANDAIASAPRYETPVSNDELVLNDVVGQAYFFRAFNYFNLVRLYGEVPLRTNPATSTTTNLAKSSVKAIYQQIIEDCKSAQGLLNGSVGNGTIKPYAASMLLAKVYMTLATAPASHTESGLNYWQLAYDEAIKVYGKYTLVSSYADLFDKEKGNNTSESIFEIQSNLTVSLDHGRAFTANRFLKGLNTFGWLKANPEVYDSHALRYPGDPRIGVTYLSTYVYQDNGSTARYYPINPNRPNFELAFPYLYKLGSNDQSDTTLESIKNFKIYRYADLLLMLAEISNELQNGQQIGYVTEVLNRVGLTPHSGYTGSQEAFRNSIMKEYQYELLGETHEWFNNRRRGYQYFLDNVIMPHNTATTFKDVIDVTHEVDESMVMQIPIPQDEINTNQELN